MLRRNHVNGVKSALCGLPAGIRPRQKGYDMYIPGKGTMLVLFVKKLLQLKSPSIAGATGGTYWYEYDYFKSKGGKQNG